YDIILSFLLNHTKVAPEASDTAVPQGVSLGCMVFQSFQSFPIPFNLPSRGCPFASSFYFSALYFEIELFFLYNMLL
ncbi:hypothetical protein, partial [Dialister hominis]|uniref:hypothetical protein n=1 Tax=Dialister hominis TaxID=2582419 RepID=UPI003FD84F59